MAIVAAAVLFGVAGAGAAQARATGLRIVAPAQGALITGRNVRVQVRGVRRRGFYALAGSKDVSKRFRSSHHGHWRTAVLRRGRDLRVGTNRLSVGSGRGAARRFIAREIVVGRRSRGMLRLRRRPGSRSALRVRIAQPKRNRHDKSFTAVQVRLDGRVVHTHDWVLGQHLSSTIWPRDRRSFDAMFGSDNGLRHGRNRLVVTAWRADGTYDRASLRMRVPRSEPLISAGRGARVKVGSRLRLHGHARTHGRRGVGMRWVIVSAPKGSHARLRHAHSARPTLVPDKPGHYRIRLIARAHRGRAVAPRPPRRLPVGRGLVHAAGAAASGPTSTTATTTSTTETTSTTQTSTTQTTSTTPTTLTTPTTPTGPGGSAPTTAVDETTVDVTPNVPAIGEQVSTITSSGAIQVGSTVYKPTSGAWAQLVVVDAGTAEVLRNQSFGSASNVTTAAIDGLASALAEVPDSEIAIVSGGDRVATFAQSTSTALVELISALGSVGDSDSWGDVVQQNLDAGKWSFVGNENNQSGTANLFGLRYGLRAGQWSQAGAITGYLAERLSVNGKQLPVSYGFVTGNVSSIDTNVPGAPAGVNEIRVGSQTYSSQPLKSGYSGFHVLVLDEWLTARENLTFVIDGPAYEVDPNATAEMAQALHAARQPGNLVVVQSIGAPAAPDGNQPSWLNDYALVSDTIGTWPYGPGYNVNAPVPRAPSIWAAQGQQNGQVGSLAAEIGMLGGPAAHDDIAQLSGQGGYTMIAAAGQLTGYDETQTQAVEPVLSTSVPVSRMQLPHSTVPGAQRPPARVVGTLSRDRQSLWKVDNASALPGPAGSQLRQIAYQPPTPWPDSGTAADAAANAYIAKQLGLTDQNGNPITDVRDAYEQASATQWTVDAGTVKGYAYPGPGHGFDQATFTAVKDQLSAEMGYVAKVWAMVAYDQTIFGKVGQAGRLDLSQIAKTITDQIKRFNARTQAVSEAMYIVEDVLWVAADALGAADFEEGEDIATATDMLAGAFDATANGLGDLPSGAPTTSPVTAAAAQIGPELATRFTNLSENVGTVGNILVSDWGKLQAAGQLPSPTVKTATAYQSALTNSVQRELYKALLSTVYGIYVVDPIWQSGHGYDSTPRGIVCHKQGPYESMHPFRTPNTASSWMHFSPGWIPYRDGFLPDNDTWYGLNHPITFSQGHPNGYPLTLPGTTSSFLFTPLTANGNSLGMDPTMLFSDSRFKRYWFSCDRA